MADSEPEAGNLGGDEAQRLRERLRLAGLLAEPGERRIRPPREEVAGARRRAGSGTALSQLVSEDR
jgi:hypothetical protein